MLIDAHLHVHGQGFWPSAYFDWVARHWAYAKLPHRDPGIVRPKIEPGLIDPGAARLIQQLDDVGVDRAVLMTVDWGPKWDRFCSVSREEVHRQTAEWVSRYPDRLIAFAGIDPRRPNAVDLLRTCLEDFGMRGLKLHPPSGFFPYDEAVFPLYQLCRQHRVPVAVHTGPSLGMTTPRFAHPLYLQDVQAAFPELEIWISHAGGRLWWDEAIAVLRAGENSYLELSGVIFPDFSEEQKRVAVRRIAAARDEFGPHRLIFGTDHSSGARVTGVGFLQELTDWYRELPSHAEREGSEFTREEVDLIMGGNAARSMALEA